jgi:hypothetical protein
MMPGSEGVEDVRDLGLCDGKSLRVTGTHGKSFSLEFECQVACFEVRIGRHAFLWRLLISSRRGDLPQTLR